MPLPFTPAEAWHLLSPETQVEIGAAVIGMHLAQYARACRKRVAFTPR